MCYVGDNQASSERTCPLLRGPWDIKTLQWPSEGLYNCFQKIGLLTLYHNIQVDSSMAKAGKGVKPV